MNRSHSKRFANPATGLPTAPRQKSNPASNDVEKLLAAAIATQI